MAKRESSKAVAKKGDGALANLDWTQYQGAGTEGAGADDYALPFLYILQTNSPQVSKHEGSYVEGAEPGMILNTVTNELFERLEVIPVAFHKEYVEWVPRDEGGGFVGRYQMNSPPSDAKPDPERFGRLVRENGHHLVDTKYHYVLGISPHTGETFQAVITMTSTQIKKSRRWLSMMGGRRVGEGDNKVVPPSFAFSYTLSTQPESNEFGKWYGWAITPGPMLESLGLFNEAKAMYDAVKAGSVKAGVMDPDAELAG